MSPLAHRFAGPLAACVWIGLSATSVFAQDPNRDALFVTVQNPITTEVANRIKNQVEARVHGTTRPVDTVVFDFNPSNADVATTEFWACVNLAEYISNLKGKTTIAFVHARVAGHSVLPVLACKELVMSKNAILGPVVVEGVPTPLDEDRQRLYQKISGSFGRGGHWPVIRKMFDANVELMKGKKREGGTDMFIDAKNKAEFDQVTGAQAIPGVQNNALGSYPAAVARQLELAKGLADSRPELASLFGLPPSAMKDDPLRGAAPDAYQWTLKGDVDGAMRESVNRVMRDVRKKKGNVLILVINCSGTDLDTARGLAEDLIKAQTDEEGGLLIIGFIPESAPDAALVVALGCSDIVMTKPKINADGSVDGKDAEIGNFERFLKSSKPNTIDAQRKSIRALAEQQGYPGVLIDGMMDRDLEIIRVRGKGDGRNKTKLMTRLEFENAIAAKEEWSEDKVIKQKGVPFHPNATLAAELGLARFTVPSTNVKDVCGVYGVSDAKNPDPGWIDKFAEFLRIPAVTIILVMIGFIGLILELKVPGLTVPGIIAALCFILVFWSQSRFSGEMFVLALLLFILGLVLIGIEIFVLPGFGACGIFGILCMLAGLGLVTLDKIPEGTAGWVSFGVKVSQYLFALMGSILLAFFIAKFLPQVPYANRLLLAPPTDQPHASDPVLPGATEAAELLGAIGTTTTALRPAGVVRFGDKFVDVVSDGGFIPSGSRVQVIVVEGTRIVVKEV